VFDEVYTSDNPLIPYGYLPMWERQIGKGGEEREHGRKGLFQRRGEIRFLYL
jgi:hypothetical protein